MLTSRRIILAIILVGIALLLYFFLPAFMPLILAFFTALVLEPLVKLTKKYLKFKKRFPAVTIVFITFILFIAYIAYLTVTKLVNEAINFIERIPYYIVEINVFIEDLLEHLNTMIAGLPHEIVVEVERQLETQTANIMEMASGLGDQAIATITDLAQGVPNFIIVTIIYLIALFLFSLELPRYIEMFYARYREENTEKVRFMLQRSARVFTGFFKAQFLVSIIIFIVTYLGLLLISPGNALLMAVIIWLIDFIPIVGSIAILGPWSGFELIAGNTVTGIQLLILASILLLIRRTVEPKVMGDQIGLPPLPTLIGLYLGFYFMGIIGLIAGPLIIIALLSAREAGIIKLDFKI